VEFFREYGAKLASVHCGNKHTVFLTDDGEVLTSGVGEYGLLGNGDTSDSHEPVSLDAFADVTIAQIGVGVDHTLALASDGSIYSWGRNNHGQLGHADTYMDIYSLESFPRKIDVKNESTGKEIKFKQVSAANGRSAAISTEGNVYVWGHRLAAHRPKLIDPTELDNLKATKIVCGGESSKAAFAILTEDHGLWTYGDLSSGLLGLPKKENNQTHAKAQRNQPERVVFLNGKKVLDVFAGLGQHMFAKVEVDLSEQH
jgi:alpha-tubulin suppressor-like RCC1 family protein